MKKEYSVLIKIIFAFVFILLLLPEIVLGQWKDKGIIYVDVEISQPNIQDCYATNVINYEHQDFIRVFPNPNQGIFQLNIDNSQGFHKLTIIAFNLSGKKIYLQEMVMDGNYLETRLDFSSLPKGIYVMRLKLDDKEFSKNIILL